MVQIMCMKVPGRRLQRKGSRLNTGWYTNILTGFNYKRSKKNTFIAHIPNNKMYSIIFRKSITKKLSSKSKSFNITARYIILKNQVTLIRCQGCAINQNLNSGERCSFKCSTISIEARAITQAIANKIGHITKLAYESHNIINIFQDTCNISSPQQSEISIPIEKFKDHHVIKAHIWELNQ